MPRGRFRAPPSETTATLYIVAIVLGIASLAFQKHWMGYALVPVILLSAFVDWYSALVATRRGMWVLTVMDSLTAANYIALFISLTLGGSPGRSFSNRVFLHWGMVFMIYIAWNIIMAAARRTDRASRRFFIYFTLAEVPVAAACLLAFAGARLGEAASGWLRQPVQRPEMLLAAIAAAHLTFLTCWLRTTLAPRPEER